MQIQINQTRNKEKPHWIQDELNGNQLLVDILLKRGINTKEKLQAFLNPTFYQPTDPDEFPDMAKAVDLILQTIKAGKSICIYGDYDVDGVTSTAILLDLLRELRANVKYHLPQRFTEGYGMNARIVRILASDTDLILTCDCGISNNHEVALAKGLGMQVIVTDHHHLPDVLPPADAIISGKFLPVNHQAYDLSGAGVAYYLVLGILNRLNKLEVARKYLDLVALSTIADIVPLKGENRYLLQTGLSVLATSKRPGLVELCNISGINQLEITEEEIAFQLAPRLNAAGRITSADLALNLLLAATESEAKPLARQLDQVNTKRRELTEQIYEEVLALLGKDAGNQPIILYQPHWHEGVLGITASKLCEDYYVPVLLMKLKEDGKTVTGSARSIPGIHIYDVLKRCEQFLTKFGGHSGAAGFSLTREKVTVFMKSMQKVLTEEFEKTKGIKQIEVDATLPLNKISPELYADLKKLAPFGEGNPLPIFLSSDVEVIYHRPTSDEKHLRLIVRQGKTQWPAIWWWGGGAEVAVTVDLVYSLGMNRWQEKEELQLIIAHTLNKTKLPTKLASKRIALEMEIEDWRNWSQVGKPLPVFNLPIFYYEGIEDFSLNNYELNKSVNLHGEVTPLGIAGVINRYQSIPADCMILISCPPGKRVLKELVYTNMPKKLILAYSDLELQSADLFLKKLAGLVKYIVTEKAGKGNIHQLSIYTGEMENTVFIGLKYLQDKGFIDFEFLTLEDIFFKKGERKAQNESQMKEVQLKTLLEESRAFKKYMLKADTEAIKKLIKSDA